MANLKKLQEDAIASIDAAKGIDKILAVTEVLSSTIAIAKNYTSNPIKFLTLILRHLDIPREEIELWLSKFLCLTIPALEMSVKTILLTNLKNMVSCSVDPRIPQKYRKRHIAPTNYETLQEYGIDISIESIDIMDKLSINPLSDYGSNWYFGLSGIEDSYKFARADDMDAFLWFVIHKGKFPNSAKVTDIKTLTDNLHSSVSKPVSVVPSNATLLTPLEVSYESNNPSTILLGNTFTYENGHIVSMCIDKKTNDSNNIIHNTIVPVSDDWSSVNWYSRPKLQVLDNDIVFPTNNNRETTYFNEERDYSKEKGIFNLQYLDQTSSDSPITGLANNKFRFTILPRPYIHTPILTIGESPWDFKKMLFNDKGEYDANGRYTFAEGATVTESVEGKTIKFTINNNVEVSLDAETRQVTVSDENELAKNLMLCYPGLTVYEFNYDYVMGLKLFDAKVLAHSLMESVLNINLENSLSLNIRYQEASERMRQIIKNIIETEETNVDSCYYTFDNSQYDLLLRKAEEKRAKQQRFGNTTHKIGLFDDVNDILKEYDERGDLNKNIETIHKAITKATLIVSESADDSNKVEIEFNFLFNLIESLTTVIINGVLSPKVLMLLEVNQTLMGGTWEKFTEEDFLFALRNVIIGIINEIRDLIVGELVKMVTKAIAPYIEFIESILIREQIENYSEKIFEIIRLWKKIDSLHGILGSIFGSIDENTILDSVDYADINTPEKNNKPLNLNC